MSQSDVDFQVDTTVQRNEPLIKGTYISYSTLHLVFFYLATAMAGWITMTFSRTLMFPRRFSLSTFALTPPAGQMFR